MRSSRTSPAAHNPLRRGVNRYRANAGTKEGGKSLLGRDEPSRWYEAADALPPLAADAANAAPADDATVEAARTQAEEALEREAEILERTMPARVGGADARWLQQVRRSGTTADKVAAHSLIIQARAHLFGDMSSLPPASAARMSSVLDNTQESADPADGQQTVDKGEL